MDWNWATGGIVAILSLLGIGKLLEMAFKARQERRAAKAALDQTNAGKAIDADVNAFVMITRRLEIVEARLDGVNSQLMDQKVENTRLEGENARLSRDNDRQEKEIIRFAERIRELAAEIKAKEDQIADLKLVVERLIGEVNALTGTRATNGQT